MICLLFAATLLFACAKTPADKPNETPAPIEETAAPESIEEGTTDYNDGDIELPELP